MFTKDEVFEYLIRAQVDGSHEAMKEVVGREPVAEDGRVMDRTIGAMYDGWVAMNHRARKLSGK